MASRTKGMTQQRDTDDEYAKMEDRVGDEELEALYAWVDTIPFSRPKRNISRDFSDGILVAEIVHHFYPLLVEMHNYTGANAAKKKVENWMTLNRKVFKKMNFELAEDVIDDLVCCKPGMIEKVLVMLRSKIENINYVKKRQSDKPEVDQHQPSPGRKDGQTIKVGLEDHRRVPARGGRHVKEAIRNNLNAKVEFNGSLDAKIQDSRRRWSQEEQDKKSPVKPAGKQGVQKKRIGQLTEPDMVPRYVVEEKEQEVLSRDETISILNSKIVKLEHLLHLKDMRIAELAGDVYGYTGPTNNNYNYRVYNKR